ncbi:hypothetical protein LCGC14_3127210, partial [marine sediment metagenome]
RLLGNIAGAGGIVTELSPTQVRTMINVEAGATADQSAAEIEAIVSHDNLQAIPANKHIDHTTVSMGTAGAGGLSGGGTIAATRALVINLGGLPQIAGNALAAADELLVSDAGVNKAMRYQDGGLIVPAPVTVTTNKTFTDAEMNQVWQYNNAADTLWDLDVGAGVKGNFIIFIQVGAGSINLTNGTATINEPDGYMFTAKQDSVVVGINVGSNVWYFYGDTAAS